MTMNDDPMPLTLLERWYLYATSKAKSGWPCTLGLAVGITFVILSFVVTAGHSRALGIGGLSIFFIGLLHAERFAGHTLLERQNRLIEKLRISLAGKQQ